MGKKFKRVLVANRGEIAIRIFRACHELGIRTVAIYTEEDKFALFRTKAHEAYQIGKNKGPVEAYLNIDEIKEIIKDQNLLELLENLENESVSQITYYIQYILIVTLIMANFSTIISLIKESIANLTGFINCLVPILLALMSATRKCCIC